VDVLRYVDGVSLAVIAVLGAVAVSMALFVRRRSGTAAAVHVLAAGLVAAWLLGVVTGTGLAMTPGGGPGEFNLVPGRGIGQQLHNYNRELGLTNLFGNVALFVPGGLLLVWLLRGRAFAVVAGLALLSVLIEVLQFLQGARAADIDDVILNATGALLGAALGWVAVRLCAAGPTTGGAAVTS
jgi:glycopeptide antibiotics resistance protein